MTPLKRLLCALCAAALCLTVTGRAHAQTAPNQPDWSALRIAKWSVATASAGTALYGFLENRRADDRYRRLEELCMADEARCHARRPDGTYADAELEAEYQAVRAIDSRARTALIAGQVGVAASVILFILDLRNVGSPANIPYEPSNFDVRPARDGGVAFRMAVPLPGNR